MKKLIAMLALTTGLAGVGLVAGQTPASAGAYGCSWWNPVTVGGYSAAAGQYCVNVAGTGTFVANVGGGFASAGNVCNSSITAEFFDSSGRWYQTFTSPTSYGCSHNITKTMAINQYVRRGFVCSTLRQNGARLSSVCHNIY
jgi:hypothetical protein